MSFYISTKLDFMSHYASGKNCYFFAQIENYTLRNHSYLQFTSNFDPDKFIIERISTLLKLVKACENHTQMLLKTTSRCSILGAWNVVNLTKKKWKYIVHMCADKSRTKYIIIVFENNLRIIFRLFFQRNNFANTPGKKRKLIIKLFSI